MARKKAKKNAAKKIDSVRHKDKRKNIPTEELRGFVKEDEAKPKEVKYPGLLYARDPSLDPQLVWKGKDEQDQEELTVPAVPIYIQEKIHPHAIIEDVRAQAKKGAGEQLDFFADFNGIEFEELIEFYQHEANWSNRMILGDSLLVMTSLAEKEGLKGKVQMIYIDPPYLRASATSRTARLKMQPASRSKSEPSATPGNSAFTHIFHTGATDSLSQGNCSRKLAVSLSRLGTKMSILYDL